MRERYATMEDIRDTEEDTRLVEGDANFELHLSDILMKVNTAQDSPPLQCVSCNREVKRPYWSCVNCISE